MSTTTHWSEIARRWKLAGPPLRPSPEDVAGYEAAVAPWIGRHGPPRVLLLGVTPELPRLPWPEGTDFLAVDRNREMIDLVWPGPADAVLQAGWTALELPEGSRDIVLCDGGLHLLDPPGQARLVEGLHRVLSPGGICVFRLFAPPEEPETPERVLHDLLEGRIPDVNRLKLRLDMALQESYRSGVELGTVWNAVHAAVPDVEDLVARTGWTVEVVRSLDAYRGSPSRYHFPTLAQVRDLFGADGRFTLSGVRTPSYDLGERCPVVVLERGKNGTPGG